MGLPPAPYKITAVPISWPPRNTDSDPAVVSATLPASSLAAHDPSAYADALQAASDSAELLDPSGLGAFVWVRVDR